MLEVQRLQRAREERGEHRERLVVSRLTAKARQAEVRCGSRGCVYFAAAWLRQMHASARGEPEGGLARLAQQMMVRGELQSERRRLGRRAAHAVEWRRPPPIVGGGGGGVVGAPPRGELTELVRDGHAAEAELRELLI